MCGITGLWQAKKRQFPREMAINLVNAMNDSVAHRGPDAEGVWSDPEGRCVLGQRRLSIIDTSDAGRQPFASSDGRWWITFNGEIYNFQELRADLEKAGVRLRGRTDTEVLLEAIVLWGTEALLRLDGMFAFAAYDTLSHSLLLARDPFGEKPLYYTVLPGGGVAFASELQALELLPGFDATVDIDAVAELLSFQYIGAPRSIYSSVLKLPPAHFMQISPRGEHHIERYFAYRPGSSGYTRRKRTDLVDELEDILARSVKRRLIADVPLGAFLSGGVDSSTVCALVRRKLKLPLQTFSTGFANAPESEHITARAFAELLGTDHHEQVIDPQAADFLRGIGAILDEPNADSSCLPVYLLSGFARETVTVALSGDGGDEMFGGYGRYFSTLEDQATRTPDELSEWCPGDSYYGPRILVSDEGHLNELFGFLPPSFERHLGQLRADIDGAGPRKLLGRLRQTDADNYMPGAVLPKVDRMSMRHALEVRTPYLNVELARFAERLPDNVLVKNSHGKLLLRDLAYRYLPRELVDLPKQGFGLPMTDWGRASLLGVATDLLDSDGCRSLPLFGREGINRFLARQRQAGGFIAYQVWALAMFESWLQYHPAVVPDLTYRRPKLAATPQPATEPLPALDPLPPVLTAAPVAERIWLVSMRGPSQPCDPRHDAGWDALPEALKRRIAELESSAVGVPSLDALELPAWDRSPLPEDRQRLAVLTGSSLVFLDADAHARITYKELLKYSELGVSRLVFAARDSDGDTEEIRLQPKPLSKRMLHTGLLFLRSRVRIANRRLFALPLRTARFVQADGSSCVATGLQQLPVNRNRDLADRFMAFEGIRQLPPLASGDAEVRDTGRGRYSVREQVLRFSPTDPERLFRYLFWLVERTPRLERLLQFVPERRHLKTPSRGALNATRIGAQTWAVARSATAERTDPLRAQDWRTVSPEVMSYIFELFGNPGLRVERGEILRLADWGVPISASDRAPLAVLRGATLVFLDPDAGNRLDYAEMHKLSELGVHRLVLDGRQPEDGIREIRIEQQSLRRRMLNCGLLFLRSRALISNRWLLRLTGAAYRSEALGGALHQASGLRRVTGDREQLDRCMVFEGIRQLPPIPATEAEIERAYGGRYAASPGRLVFSPTEPARRFSHPYWIVDQSPATERLLRFIPKQRPAIVSRQMTEAFDRLLGANEAGAGFALEPGDPVVVFTHALPPGGAERQWVYLAQGLKDAGYDVTFVTYCELSEGNGHYLPLLAAADVAHHTVGHCPLTIEDLLEAGPALYHAVSSGTIPDPELLFGITKFFRQLRPRAVITQLDHPNLFAGFAAFLADVPRIVLSFRNYNPSNFDYIYAEWYRPAYELLARSNRVLFSGNSTAASRDYEEWIGLEPGRVAFIPNALDPDHFTVASPESIGAVRRELQLDPGQPIVLGVFRLSKEKSPETFIEVCSRLAVDYPNLRVLVAGVGPLLPELEQAAAEQGLGPKIQFLGRRTDINVLMSLANLLLLTSKHEGMPNVVVEAQLMGLPVVATDAGGTRDALRPGLTGIVCPIGDVDELYAACCRVIADPRLARAMGAAGRRLAATEFSKPLMARRYIDFISGRDPADTVLPEEPDTGVIALRA